MVSGITQSGGERAPVRDNLFVWTVFLLLLAGLVFSCWLGSFYVFNHPEQPRAYRLLKRLNKLPPPVRFALTKAPAGEFLEAQRVFERYSKFTAAQFSYENELLFRSYLRNYGESKRLVTYLTGKYVVLKAYELQKSDLFTSGVVVLTQSAAFPQVLAEIIYPTSPENVKELLPLLQPGLEVRLQKTMDLSAIVQVSHATDGRLQVTVVPLLYGNYALKNGVGSFSLEPPEMLNVAAGFPVVRGEEVRSVIREVTRHRNLAGGASTVNADAAQIEIVRVDDIQEGAPSNPLAVQPVHSEDAEGRSVTSVTTGLREVPRGEPSPEAAPSVVASAAPVAMDSLPSTVPKVQVVQNNARVNKAEKGTINGSPLPLVAPTQNLLGGTAKTAGVENGGKQEPKKPIAPVLPSGAKPAEAMSASSVASPPATLANTSSSAVVAGASASVPSQADQPRPGTPEAIAQAFLATKGQSRAAAPQLLGAGSVTSTPTSPQGGVGAVKSATKIGQPSPTSSPAAKSAAEAEPPTAAAPVPLKPFLAAAAAPSLTQPTGSWKTVSRQPVGKSITPEQASTLQGRNDSAPLYLHGKFVVTAAGANRAVLRQSSSDGRTLTRVIVEYPAGAVPPQQGASIAREDGRGFEIREVRRSPDGQVNIYVREVLSP